jgi:glycosyltransferase involved in cell wall biosynthesis
MNIKYSIIIPTHRREKLLHRCLSSIKQQQHHNIEIIVISDCIHKETDQVCSEILESTDIFIRRSGKPGPATSRNIGLQLATGDFIVFLDDDDSFDESLFQKLNELDIRSDYIYTTNCIVVKESREDINNPLFISQTELNLEGSLNENIYVKNQLPFSCYIFPSFFLKGRYFDSSLRAYEDWDYLLDVIKAHKICHIPIIGPKIYQVDDHTSDRRGNSSAANDFNAVLDYLSIYRKHPAPTEGLKIQRETLLAQVGLTIAGKFL